MKSFQEINNNLAQWAVDRNLTNVDAQVLKLLDELGELAEAVLKGNRAAQMDELGDVMVVCFLIDQMKNQRQSIDEAERLPHHIAIVTQERTIARGEDEHIGHNIALCARRLLHAAEDNFHVSLRYAIWLTRLASHLKIDPLEALNGAWVKIEKRTGHTNEMGVFVKDTQ